MDQVIIDDETKARLHGLEKSLELCDSSGRILGYLTPASDRSIYQGLQSSNSRDELDRRLREDERFTTADVLRHLEHPMKHRMFAAPRAGGLAS